MWGSLVTLPSYVAGPPWTSWPSWSPRAAGNKWNPRTPGKRQGQSNGDENISSVWFRSCSFHLNWTGSYLTVLMGSSQTLSSFPHFLLFYAWHKIDASYFLSSICTYFSPVANSVLECFTNLLQNKRFIWFTESAVQKFWAAPHFFIFLESDS